MTEAATVTEPTETPATEPSEAAEAPPANDVVANDVEGGEPPPAAEAAPAEPEKGKEDKPTALFNRAMRLREETNAKLQKVAETHQEIRREREIFAKEKAEVDTWRQQMARIKEDPHLFFEVFDVDPTDHMRKMMALSEPVAREIAAERKARQELEKKLEEERQARQSEAVSANVHRAKSSFVAFLADNHETYPDIADEDPREVAEVFWELASEHHKTAGRAPTMQMVAQYMQRQAEEKRATRERRRQQRLGARPATATSEPGGGTTALQRTAPTATPANGPGLRTPKTLTNGAATQVATAPKENATEEEIDEWTRAELRRLRTSLAAE